MHSWASPDPKLRAAATYNAAADCFDDPALSFWDRIGRRTVERLGLPAGASVLDACCGTGASALPAAQAVGAKGKVLGVDLAERLLVLARRKASGLGLRNVEFRRDDVESLAPAAEQFDAVICVFGIFFFPDMTGAAAHLWRLVRDGGQLAITTWGPRVLEPGSMAAWAAIQAERPNLYRGFHPWDRINEPEMLGALLLDAGIRAEVAEESSVQHLKTADDFWTIAMGSGFRGTIEQLDAEARERVRRATITRLAGTSTVETNAVYAIARK
jgi:ubiquinone/menaquinone biosynthesis C-methylase UbiE